MNDRKSQPWFETLFQASIHFQSKFHDRFITIPRISKRDRF